MTAPPSPPNRRRRRIVVVTVVVLLVGLCWWLGSGVDKRFVGQWVDKEGIVRHLDADGHYFVTAEGLTDDGGQRWWISGNRIVVYTPSQNEFIDARNWLMYFVRRVTGKRVYGLPFEDCLITKFDGETMQLDGEQDLKRVSEIPAAR